MERLRSLLRAVYLGGGAAEAVPADDSLRRLAAALGLADAAALHDFLAALLLSDIVYKSADTGGAAGARAALAALLAALPPGAVRLEGVQFSAAARGGQRYLLARGGGALYAIAMGTKAWRDVAADAALAPRALAWPAIGGKDNDDGDGGGGGGAAHGGFLARAERLPAEALWAAARRAGLRLVFAGHSLGGAVAQLAALRLLTALPAPPLRNELAAIAFGTPPASTAALAARVAAAGWDGFFSSYALPEDPVPRLRLAPPAAPAAAAPGTGREPAPWARRALRAAAGSAQLPAFSHLGAALLLLPDGVRAEAAAAPVAETGGGAEPGGEAAAAAAAEAAEAAAGWLGAHRMGAYRARVLALCRRALPGGWQVTEAELAAVPAAALAPKLAVSGAAGALPVMWAPGAAAAPRARRALGLLPPAGGASGAAAGLPAGLPPTYELVLLARGRGLEWVTGAELRLPGGAAARAAPPRAAARALALRLAAGAADAELELELTFPAVPTAALLQLALAPGAVVAPAALALASDFGHAEAGAELAPRAVWILSPYAALGAACCAALRREAERDALEARAAAGGRQPEPDAEAAAPPPEPVGGLRARLRRLALWPAAPPPPPAFLLRAAVVVDASALLEGGGGAAARLALAAELLHWRRRRAAVCDGGEAGEWAVSGEDDWPELAPRRSLAAAVAQRARAAGAGAARRAAALARRRAAAALPPPAALALVLRAGELEGPAAGARAEARRVALLAAAAAVAGAAARAGAPLLLAVAAPEPLDAPRRLRISFAAGLAGRPGAVAPLPLPRAAAAGAPEELDASALRDGLLAHAALRPPRARL
jgi:hypothetical protein